MCAPDPQLSPDAVAANALDLARLRTLLPAQIAELVEVVDSIDSTNTELARRAADDPTVPDFSVLTAEEQTAGLARLDRRWSSPKYSSLSTSFLLRPSVADFSWIVLLLAEAAVHTAQQYGVPAAIKWPNDVVAVDQSQKTVKLAGILAQLVNPADGAAPVLVVGIGLNITDKPSVQQAPTAPTTPGCFADFLSTGVPPNDSDVAAQLNRTEILAALISRFHQNYLEWQNAAALGTGGGWAARRISPVMATIGQMVKVMPASGEAYLGQALRLGSNGELIVKTGQGECAVHVGDITHLRPVADLQDGGWQ